MQGSDQGKSCQRNGVDAGGRLEHQTHCLAAPSQGEREGMVVEGPTLLGRLDKVWQRGWEVLESTSAVRGKWCLPSAGGLSFPSHLGDWQGAPQRGGLGTSTVMGFRAHVLGARP